MLAKVLSGALVGLDGILVDVEVDISSQGLPSFTIVGLPDKAVEESRERVRSALKNSGFDFPSKRITVNLAPADLPKEGPSYDLPIALGILIASEQLKAEISDSLFTGELSLDGKLRYTNGILPQALLAKEKKLKIVFVPKINANEASIIEGVKIFALNNLIELFYHLNKQKIFVTSKASERLRFGRIEGRVRARSVFPAPGGPFKSMLCPPAAAISKALFACSCPWTSFISKSKSSFLKWLLSFVVFCGFKIFCLFR